MSERAGIYRAQVLEKIDHLLTEFAEGKVSREQFHAIYEHYSNQLALVEQMDRPGADLGLDGVPGATIAIRQAHMAKALGLIIYHNKSGKFVETLGEFDIQPGVMAQTLNDFSTMMDAQQYIDRRVVKLPDRRWLLFAAGRFTTVVSVFFHEPSPQQMREVERLHHDFEMANATALGSSIAIDKNALAYPFVVILQKKLKQK
jgi:hypothetical protein